MNVGIIAAITASPNLLAHINAYDGGLAASAGTFIAHGALPYRDFWWLYGPGAPLLVATATAVAGPSLLLIRLLGLTLVGLQGAMAYAVVRERAPHRAAALIAVGAVATPVFILGLEVSAWSLSLTLALGGLILRDARPRSGLVAGILIGVAFATRLDVGAYALIAAMIAGGRLRLVAGFAFVAAPVAAVALATTPMADLYEQLIWFPLIGTRQFRAVPFPLLDSAPAFGEFIATFVVPKVVLIIAAAQIATDRQTRRRLLALASFAALCQLQTLGRADVFHEAQASLPAYLVLGWLSGGSMAIVPSPGSLRTRLTRLASFSGAAGACALSLVLAALSVPSAEVGAVAPDESEDIAAVRTLMANTSSDQTVYVGLTEHRYTLINDMAIYYLADRAAGVRVAMFNPGVTNTDRVQTAMVADLQARSTSVLYLDERFAQKFESTNDSAIPGSTILDRFIATTYVEACRYGPIRILTLPGRLAGFRCVAQDDQERLLDVIGGIARR